MSAARLSVGSDTLKGHTDTSSLSLSLRLNQEWHIA